MRGSILMLRTSTKLTVVFVASYGHAILSLTNLEKGLRSRRLGEHFRAPNIQASLLGRRCQIMQRKKGPGGLEDFGMLFLVVTALKVWGSWGLAALQGRKESFSA